MDGVVVKKVVLENCMREFVGWIYEMWEEVVGLVKVSCIMVYFVVIFVFNFLVVLFYFGDYLIKLFLNIGRCCYYYLLF